MKLIDKLPFFYEECPKTNTIQDSLDVEINNLYSKVEGTINQLYVSSATWALSEWEKFAGIKKTDGTVEQRRTRVASKLKAKGTTTLEVMKSLCKSYSEDIKVTEIFNEYKILLELVITKENDIPKTYNFIDMNEAIWEIKPAHLSHEIDINNSRKLNIKTNYEDIKFKYIPCNCAYAGEFQPNTYNKDSELLNLKPSDETSSMNTSIVGVAIVGFATLGIS
ncbi:MAG: DUF2313 domain-containing protein [Peptostreptococcaceae bacterium]|nr:DUF2313 domain-containing protein [Peptostreptococcaceae bacterium]